LFDLVNQLKKAPHGPQSLLFHHLEVLDEEMELFFKRRKSLPVIKGPKADPFKLKIVHLSVEQDKLLPFSIGAAKMAALDFSTCLAWQVEQVRLVRNATCHFYRYLQRTGERTRDGHWLFIPNPPEIRLHS
jgi:hypothetical protein